MKLSMKSLTLAVLVSLAPMSFTMPEAFAAVPTDDSIEAQIEEQEQLLAALNARRNAKKDAELKTELSDLQKQIRKLQDSNKNKNASYDAKGAIEALMAQMQDIQKELDEQQQTQKLLNEALQKLDKLTAKQAEAPKAMPSYQSYTGSTSSLINPAPTGNLSYTQDAKNAQNNSTMVFSYAPDQIYKIYCRTGYLTDISLKKGEKISFVGGGDTSAWAINSATVDGVPHLYIKPTVTTNTTNIIVTTDKRSYQLIVNTSDWYNPMVRWTYGQEDIAKGMLQDQKDKESITDTFGVTDMDKLNFDYKVTTKGSRANKPEMVFDDGEKTIIRFKKANKSMPALFIRERGHKSVSLANYKQRDNAYILDRVIDKAELRYSDNDIVTIERTAAN